MKPVQQFPVEEESNSCLPFLDVLLRHEADGSVSTSVYRKATHTDRYLDFESHHSLSHKKSVISTLYSRVETHSSSQPLKTTETEHISHTLKINGYPSALICHQTSHRVHVQQQPLLSNRPE